LSVRLFAALRNAHIYLQGQQSKYFRMTLIYDKQLAHVLQLIDIIQPIRHKTQMSSGTGDHIHLCLRRSAFRSPGVSADSGALRCSVIIHVIRKDF
jgi:hypothetical protein